MRLVAFRKLWIASAFEGIGDEASRVVIPIVAVSMLGAGSWEVGIINALGMSAFLVLGLPVGVWVDRLRRRRLMITADVFRAVVVLSVPAAFMAGAMTIGHLLVCVALISVADVVFTTAQERSSLRWWAGIGSATPMPGCNRPPARSPSAPRP